MESIRIVEVGARDGLQNETMSLSADIKMALIRRLWQCGISDIEAGAFVSPQWVPQMANSFEVIAPLIAELHLGKTVSPNLPINLSALVPNEKGLEAAIQSGVKTIAVFTAASESFNRKNINASIAQSFQRIAPIVKRALDLGMRVRGYVSCVVACPYEGEVAPQATAEVAAQLADLGCYEISLGDTIGKAVPRTTLAMLSAVAKVVPMRQLAGHFHDTYGMAIANIHACLSAGMRVFDASVGGLGGCPYAPGAGGNVATEDVVYFLHHEGFDSGINLPSLIEVADWILPQLNRPISSKVAKAYKSRLIGAIE